MTVTAILYTADGSAASVFVDGEERAVLPADDVPALALYEGKELDREALFALRRRGDARYALGKALRTIDAQDITKKRLAERLRGKGVSAELAAETAAFCEAQGFIDDRRYADYNVSYYAETKRFGRRRILQELLRRGVPREEAQAALDGAELDEAASLRWWLETKYAGRDLRDPRERRRAAEQLTRAGFDWEDIRAALAAREEADD